MTGVQTCALPISLVLHDVPVTALGRKAQTLESVAPIQGSGKSMLAVSINLFAHLIHIILTGVLVSAFIIDSFKKRTMDLMFSYPIGRKKILLFQMICAALSNSGKSYPVFP